MAGDSDACAVCWRVFPIVASALIGLLGWGISVESRIGNIQTIQAERTVKVAAVEAHLSEVAKAAYDPAPKPETKVQIGAMQADHERMEQRLDRLEERFNNFHQFLLQTTPKAFPPGRRGMAPFRLDPNEDSKG